MIEILYPFFFVLIWLGFKIAFFLRVKGVGNIPGRKTKILICANHTAYSDPVFVTMAFGPFRRLRYMAKSSIFKTKIKNYFLRRLGAFPIDQRSGDVASIRHAIEEIGKGKPVLVFPEGSRRLRGLDEIPALPGVGMIALKADCVILPVYITPYLAPFQRKTVVVGKPFRPERKEGERPGAAYRRIAEETLETIRELGKSVGEGW